MTPRPWIALVRSLFAYMRAQGWGKRGTFMMRGNTFRIIGMPVIWQARAADNDNAVRT